MTSKIQLKRARSSLSPVALALVCFALLPVAQAVNPPPDGGYPGFTTAEGNSALQNLNTGVGNTATGWHSLFVNTTGNLNTAIGAGTLVLNTGDNNTATGALALLNNTTGFKNTASGAFALFSNTTASFNTAIGHEALKQNTTGINNTATGESALQSNIDGYQNTATGTNALASNVTGHNNTAIGQRTLAFNTTGDDNTVVGQEAGLIITGSGNTAVGEDALSNATTGSGNIGIGLDAGANMTTANNVISIGSPGDGTAFGTSDRCFIGNIRGASVGNNDGVNVIIDSDGQLGTVNSSRRFKKDIKPMDQTSETILALKPVTFHYRDGDTKKAEGTPQFGLIAEDVAEVNPDLVVRDADGEPLSVRYDQVNAMLLNEFLKEHRKVEQLEKQIEALTAGLQKVSAQLEASKPAPQVVNNP